MTYLRDFMCDRGPRRYEDTDYEAVYDREQGALVQGTKRDDASPGQIRCDEVRSEVMRRLHANDSDLLTKIILTLNWDYGAHITGIENDQWSGIAAETYAVANPSSDARPKVKVYVECDELEDGIARVWKFFADEVPLRGEGSFTFSDADAGQGDP